MTSVSPTTKPKPPDTILRIDTEPVTIPGGWRGAVAVRLHRSQGERALADVDDWQTALRAFLEDPLALDDAATLKYSSGAEVIRGLLACGPQRLDVVAKHHTPCGFSGRLSTMVSGAHAQRNFDRAVSLLATGVNTAVPLAWIQCDRGKRESWLLTSFAPELVDLDHIALSLLPQRDAGAAHRIKQRMIHAVAAMFRALIEGGWHHRDLKASNVLLQHWDAPDDAVAAWIVDLDGLSHRGKRSRNETQRLVRLAASLRSYVSITRTDYVRFLKAYRGVDRAVGDWRGEFRTLAREAEHYVTRSTRRKSHKIDGYDGD